MTSSRFAYRAPDQDQVFALDTLRLEFAAVETMIESMCPAGRYKALAFTYLEIAAMFANKAITHPEA